MYKRLVFASIFVAFMGLMTAPVFADTTTVPDFNLFICQSCTVPPASPTLITNTSSFNVGDGGNHATLGPLLIIVGTYNGAPAPTLSFGSNMTITPGAPLGLYGYNGAEGLPFNAGSPDAYTALGITPNGGGSSQMFSNWNSAEGLGAFGIAPATFFSLYVYDIPGAFLPAMGVINLDMTGGTKGDVVIGYSCEVNATPCPNGNEGATPFTTTGIIGNTVTAPEPGSLMLLGTGLIGLAGFARRRFAA